MAGILSTVLSVSLGLRGPDSLPGSRATIVLCLVPWVAVSACGSLLLHPEPPGLAVMLLVFDLLLLFAFSRFVVWVHERLARWPQTLVSLVAVQTLISTLQLPLVYFSAGQEEPGFVFVAAGYGFLLWWLLASGNILAKAVDRRLWVGVALSAAHFVLSLLMYASLLQFFGVTPGTA